MKKENTRVRDEREDEPWLVGWLMLMLTPPPSGWVCLYVGKGVDGPSPHGHETNRGSRIESIRELERGAWRRRERGEGRATAEGKREGKRGEGV
jgi:hypothetical protein